MSHKSLGFPFGNLSRYCLTLLLCGIDSSSLGCVRSRLG
nr:MAG TPA: hypothetical protein [Caudoviricetes sp.]